MKNSLFGSLLRRNLFRLIIHPAVYVAGFFFVFFVNFVFFYLMGFFNYETASLDFRHIFTIIPYVSILIIPTIVLSSSDDEKYSGENIPASDTSLVLAKLLSVFIIYTLFLLLSLPSILILNNFGDIRMSQLFTGYICMLLYGICLCSFCCYIRECFSSKSIAFFVSTIIMLFASTTHILPQYIKLPNFFPSFLTSFSIAWHTDAAGKGIIDTKDILFFLSLAIMFIWLSIIKKESKKKKRQYIYSLLVICAGLLTICASNLFYIRIDTTEEKQFSVSDEGKKIIATTEAPLSITYYLSPELESLYPQVRDVKEYLYTIAAENNNISVLTVNPEDLESKKRLDNLGIISQQLQTTEQNKTSYINVYSSILFEYGSNAAVIPFLLSTSSLEYDIIFRVRALTTGSTGMVLIYMGNGLSTDEYYPYLKPWLQSSGYICQEISAEDLYDYKVSTNTILLVVGSSESQSSDAAAIENWIMRGGSTFFSTSPNTTDIKGTWHSEHTGTDSIIEMLDCMGTGLDSGICADSLSYTIRMYSSANNEAQYINYPYWLYSVYNDDIITNSLQPLIMYWASPLYFSSKSDVSVTPLVLTSEKAWLLYPDDTDGAYITDPFLIQHLEHDKKTEGQYVMSAALEGSFSGCYDKRKSPSVRMIVTGDQYFLSSIVENTNSLYSNMDFLLSSILWLNRDENLISIKNKANVNTKPYKTASEAEFTAQIFYVKAICLVITPMVFLFAYILVYILRKRILRKRLAIK